MWGRRRPVQWTRNAEWRTGNRNVPSGAGQETVDQGGVERRALELLHKRGLVERNTGGERLGNDTLTFGDELGGQSGRRGDRVSTSTLNNRQNMSGASRSRGRATRRRQMGRGIDVSGTRPGWGSCAQPKQPATWRGRVTQANHSPAGDRRGVGPAANRPGPGRELQSAGRLGDARRVGRARGWGLRRTRTRKISGATP